MGKGPCRCGGGPSLRCGIKKGRGCPFFLWGGPCFCVCVRRRPALPRGLPRSTLGAGWLNFRVRYGSGCFPAAVAAVTSVRALCCCVCGLWFCVAGLWCRPGWWWPGGGVGGGFVLWVLYRDAGSAWFCGFPRVVGVSWLWGWLLCVKSSAY